MEFMIGLGFGWGLGIAFAFSISKMLWPEYENIWERYQRERDKVNEAVKKAVKSS